MEFHISRRARDRYQFDESLFALSGNVIFANLRAVRLFAQKMNDKRDVVNFPEQAVRAGQLNAMGLVDEIMHYIIGLYREEVDREAFKQAQEWLLERFSREAVEGALMKFAEEFPSVGAYRQRTSPEAYLNAETDGVPNRQIALEEMLTLWLANMSPAFSPFKELFDDTTLRRESPYLDIISSLYSFFNTQPRFGPDGENLVDMLRSPAVAAPYSLSGQLQYIWGKWGRLLGKYLYRLLGSLDAIKEEEKTGLLGPGAARVYDFSKVGAAPENFSVDREWVPRVVLMAKSAYVWLDQLSRKYQRPIFRLDHIPDEELDTLARWGFSGLWLIGLWERSKASERIKRMLGNPEAVASAYSLLDYQIAADLGGEEAFQNLKERAWTRGIRLASDMVPNHMGIDSRWVIEHHDRFLSLDYSPFPSHSFSGPDLSWDERVGLFLEDHYYSRSDAAVVFKRVDRWSGSEKFIYHGNDGTSMPWNDTAQLNYLDPEVREAVIQTILEVARRFPIIRFDAAMTLTKEHYQRLWFPEPGSGGDIPSRAEHGMTRAQFNALMPQEFWREVVDRVAQEAPDTLLLAEAFWLMESYFVRTLGMHRVYNSAFMNMLKSEENARYRTSIKNVLEFNPEILKRFVNFMNNPDEETAVAQFGKEDKYFGVCMMMVTMPGLPMFGHGQIEGFTEKYGMEYRRAYWDEQPDWQLVQRHEREIFLLMQRRHLFEDVENFLLYDFLTPDGHVNENVFAYSNSCGDERALVAYNNKFDGARGWIRTSAAYSARSGQGDGRTLVRRDLGDALGLHSEEDYYCIFRDPVSGLQYIRNSKELCEKGLYLDLGAYKYKVFLDFTEAQDNVWRHYAQLAAYLDGGGVPSIEEALREIFSQPVQQAFKELVNPGMFRWIIDNRTTDPGEPLNQAVLEEVEQKMAALLREIKQFTQSAGDEAAVAREVRGELETALRLPVLEGEGWWPESRKYAGGPRFLKTRLGPDLFVWGTLLGWLFVHSLGKISGEAGFEEQSRSWIDEWLLGKTMAETLKEMGLEELQASRSVAAIKLLTGHQRWHAGKAGAYGTLESILTDDEVQQFLGVNRYQDVLWYNKESFGDLLWWMLAVAVVDSASNRERTVKEVSEEITRHYDVIQALRRADRKSGYQVKELLGQVRPK